MSFIDEFMKSYGPEVSKQLSKNLGIKPNVATQLIPEIAPLILGGLKRQMEQRGGAPRVDHILNKYGSANVLDNIGGLFGKQVKNEKPDPALGGLLGDSGTQAASMIAQKFNINAGTAMKLIPMLAPLILGALTQKRDGGAGISGIASMLDQDGDGSILDDVAGFLLKGVMGGGQQSSGGGGLLGGILGGLLGGKKKG
ncbi:DUF937 domain-containing protein [candidate division KSB1 bacterium]|nr:DUF937 domain-containing protein [candidate division KSB1 bacterium]